MKKLTYGALFLALTGMTMVGCKKDNSIQPVRKPKPLMTRIDSLNAAWEKSPAYSKDSSTDWSLLATASLEGAAIGEDIDTDGNGAAIVGALSAYGSAYSILPPNTPGTPPPFIKPIEAMKINTIPVNAIPYLQSGIMFSEIMKAIMLQWPPDPGSTYQFNDPIPGIDIVIVDSSSDDIIVSEGDTHHLKPYKETIQKILLMNSRQTNSNTIKKGLKQNVDAAVYDILAKFIDVSAHLTEQDAYNTYLKEFQSIAMEAAVDNPLYEDEGLSGTNPMYEEDDRKVVLIATSVAYYSSSFWHTATN